MYTDKKLRISVAQPHKYYTLLITCFIYISFIYLCFPFSIWGDFPRFRVLGFEVIFCGSAVPGSGSPPASKWDTCELPLFALEYSLVLGPWEQIQISDGGA